MEEVESGHAGPAEQHAILREGWKHELVEVLDGRVTTVVVLRPAVRQLYRQGRGENSAERQRYGGARGQLPGCQTACARQQQPDTEGRPYGNHQVRREEEDGNVGHVVLQEIAHLYDVSYGEKTKGRTVPAAHVPCPDER
jgi:hypothetical protein